MRRWRGNYKLNLIGGLVDLINPRSSSSGEIKKWDQRAKRNMTASGRDVLNKIFSKISPLPRAQHLTLVQR